MRTAVVDIGTNSTRLLIADVDDGRVTDELERHSVVTRLGKGVDADGSLDEEAMERVYSTLEDYHELIEGHGADRALAVLTSAVRDAANGPEFADTVRERFGLEPHILTGDEEARLTFLGATSERDPDDPTPTLVVDIGGGSTEMVIGTGHEASFHVSNQAGVVRQTERHIHSDPPTAGERDALAKDVREIFSAGVPEDQRRAVEHAIAVAGTATSLGAIAQELEPYDPEKVHGYVLSAQEIDEMLEHLASLPLDQRREVPGLHPDRAPTIVAGAIILVETLRLFGLERIEVSEHDILRGAALGLGPAAIRESG
jgi:exopolyphosphatase / guanosine-5'-triphosphate,3'-diphosphate pyrophosphatase